MPRIRPTVESHLELHTPVIDAESEKWAWPYWKFDFESPAVLFNSLHAEYNSIRCAIQDPCCWHSDVCELAHVAENREQFLALLRKRQDERFKELESAWHKIAVNLIADNDLFVMPRERTDMWTRFIRITQHFSYDAVVGYFGAYVQDEDNASSRKTPVEPEFSDELKLRLQQAGARVEEQPDGPHHEPEITIHSKPEMVDQSTQTTPPKSIQKATETKQQPHPIPKSPHRVVKRQTRRSKPAASNPEGLRRSARLQQRAERGKK
ncbi:hypothetical protein GGR55DRAFT_637961 [Xylaria sp. FL0064]|nr:hypothetical protein GGR55DRAFT_637961 [Xylaria sp. FL0064]